MKTNRIYKWISVAITLGFIACMYFFPNALGRLVESVRDFGLSCVYYFCEIFQIDHTIVPTVNDYPKIPFFNFSRPSDSLPSAPIPDTLEDFKAEWTAYWRLWATKDNLSAYLSALGNFLYYLAYALLILMPFILIFVILFRRYLKSGNTDHGRESKPLQIFKKLSDVTYRPIKRFLCDFADFLKATPVFLKIWAVLWAFYFNLFTIVIEFFAFYLYLVISFDFGSIYRQVYKLFLDLWVIFDFLPGWVIALAALWIFNLVCRNIGYAELYHRERRNRGFINERGVVTIVYGEMGTGKPRSSPIWHYPPKYSSATKPLRSFSNRI